MDNAVAMNRTAEALVDAAQDHKRARAFHRNENIKCNEALARIREKAEALGIKLTTKAKGA